LVTGTPDVSRVVVVIVFVTGITSSVVVHVVTTGEPEESMVVAEKELVMGTSVTVLVTSRIVGIPSLVVVIVLVCFTGISY
jgi:hypothetical protein